jgi:hypothetical protein
MIRDEAIAKNALDLISKAHNLLMSSLSVVEANCSGAEYKEFQSEMAQVLGRLFSLVMEPICREHPALVPADTPKDFLDRWRKSSDGGTPR